MTDMDTSVYVTNLRNLLENHADPDNAFSMKKYMRDKFEFFGISSPKRKELFRVFLKEHGYPPPDQLEWVCRALYSQPERELHYFAVEIINKQFKNLIEDDVKLLEYMIVTNAWWDTVDFIAAGIAGKFFLKYPGLINLVTRKWMDSGNIWLRRTCILFQMKYKNRLDTDLLYSIIDELRTSDEFFIKKAIGWILREYSKVNPDEVKRYTASVKLKPLSMREALKIIEKNK
jgi:3-methyladenine DNA glycosylase AlkD